MADDPHRPQHVEMLVTDFGAHIGIPELAFDEDNLLALRSEAADLALTYQDEVLGVLIRSLIDLPHVEPGADFATSLHCLNYRAMLAGMGMLTIDSELGAFVWVDRINLRGMTVQMLFEAIATAERGIVFWREHLPELLAQSAAAAAGSSQAPDGMSIFHV